VLARIEVQGPETRALLLKGGSLDLHPSRFPPGALCTHASRLTPYVLRCMGPTNFECIITRSYQSYLLSWLGDAAEGFFDSRHA
jgi:heterotetrameric sarcosine oxidase gamma subunit